MSSVIPDATIHREESSQCTISKRYTSLVPKAEYAFLILEVYDKLHVVECEGKVATTF